jgi:hypothetical protein
MFAATHLTSTLSHVHHMHMAEALYLPLWRWKPRQHGIDGARRKGSA